MNCTKCDEPQRDGARYCHNCGAGRRRKGGTPPVIVAVLMVAAFLSVCWLGSVVAEKGEAKGLVQLEREAAGVYVRDAAAYYRNKDRLYHMGWSDKWAGRPMDRDIPAYVFGYRDATKVAERPDD